MNAAPENADAANDQQQAYFGKPDGLLELFNDIKSVSGQILRLNQDNMAAWPARKHGGLRFIRWGGSSAGWQ